MMFEFIIRHSKLCFQSMLRRRSHDWFLKKLKNIEPKELSEEASESSKNVKQLKTTKTSTERKENSSKMLNFLSASRYS